MRTKEPGELWGQGRKISSAGNVDIGDLFRAREELEKKVRIGDEKTVTGKKNGNQFLPNKTPKGTPGSPSKKCRPRQRHRQYITAAEDLWNGKAGRSDSLVVCVTCLQPMLRLTVEMGKKRAYMAGHFTNWSRWYISAVWHF